MFTNTKCKHLLEYNQFKYRQYSLSQSEPDISISMKYKTHKYHDTLHIVTLKVGLISMNYSVADEGFHRGASTPQVQTKPDTYPSCPQIHHWALNTFRAPVFLKPNTLTNFAGTGHEYLRNTSQSIF